MQPRGIHARRSRRSADDNARSASDFIAMPILSLTHRKTVRFHPRFEIGEQSEKTFSALPRSRRIFLISCENLWKKE